MGSGSWKVVVLDAGRLVEQGSPNDLLNPDADGRTESVLRWHT